MAVLLCILDGWGHSDNQKYNAIYKTKTPYWDHLTKLYPKCKIAASGKAVGLPPGQMGNSEIGHTTIGSGRIIEHSLIRLNREIKNINKNKSVTNFCNKIKKNNGICHLVSLLSPGGVHSHINHIMSLQNFLQKYSIATKLHAILDGRDTPPRSAIQHIEHFSPNTICGRYYAMDRDKNWHRTKKAYNLIMYGQGEKFISAEKAINNFYDRGIIDEFILPTVIGDYNGMQEGDGVIICNFRPDRVKQLVAALNGKTDFSNTLLPEVLGMVEYSQELQQESILPKLKITDTLGEVVARNNMKQLRIAETEKYSHVTFFFNGGSEEQFSNEERILIPSPKVDTYDLMPEMSAFEITDKLINEIAENKFDLIVLNYANPDMVGHSGNINATIKAIETIDQCLKKLVPTAIQNGMETIITADHGNAELMYDDANNSPHTSHTTNPVPLLLISNKKVTLKDGGLADIAPTILKLLNLTKPSIMTGNALFYS